jgi:hypothetical protein
MAAVKVNAKLAKKSTGNSRWRTRDRREKRETIDQQIASGRLTVRQMTAEERRRWPPPSTGEGEDDGSYD